MKSKTTTKGKGNGNGKTTTKESHDWPKLFKKHRTLSAVSKAVGMEPAEVRRQAAEAGVKLRGRQPGADATPAKETEETAAETEIARLKRQIADLEKGKTKAPRVTTFKAASFETVAKPCSEKNGKPSAFFFVSFRSEERGDKAAFFGSPLFLNRGSFGGIDGEVKVKVTVERID